MSNLSRYQKPGGFMQLINLLETSSVDKRQKFLAMIREENEFWAAMLEKKMLTFQRVFTWNTSVQFEVFSRIQTNVLGHGLHGFDEEHKQKILGLFPSSTKRKIEDAYQEKQPTAGEIVTVQERILAEIRKITSEGSTKLEKIDPDMAIPDGIEEILKKQTEDAALHSSVDQLEKSLLESQQESPDTHVEKNQSQVEELVLIKKKLGLALQENQLLKTEVNRLRTKIEQIKKAAA